eukprot:gene10253-biopygen19794
MPAREQLCRGHHRGRTSPRAGRARSCGGSCTMHETLRVHARARSHSARPVPWCPYCKMRLSGSPLPLCFWALGAPGPGVCAGREPDTERL